MNARSIAELVDADAARLELVRDKRRRVDVLRVTHDRLQRELQALDQSPTAWRSQRAVDAMRDELARTTAELRAATRDLLRSI